jgi:hypothetical protein
MSSFVLMVRLFITPLRSCNARAAREPARAVAEGGLTPLKPPYPWVGDTRPGEPCRRGECPENPRADRSKNAGVCLALGPGT